ncbi:MAG: endo-1,4-beta-xylanase [Bacteroidales bacterium]|nr:endo-1,4-beta-xylanase [Bacteroidales bacterium]
MQINLIKKLCTVALLLSAGSAVAQFPFMRPEPEDPTGLKDAYKDYFKMGVAVNMRNMQNPDEVAIILKEYNSVTAENDMKPGSLQPKEGEWNWGNADTIANFCRKHGIKMRGHCLVWHSQFCDWMFTDKNGKDVSKEVFYERLKKHITTVVNRYKDVVYCWDVVNEAMADDVRRSPWNPNPSPYRNSKLYQLCGDEFIAKAFQFAHEADPNAQLFYNDYNAANPDKRDRIFDMVKKMKDNGVPIDGIGMQGHYNVYGPSMKNIADAIEKYATIVKHIQFTELDVRANEEMGGQLQFSRNEGVTIEPYVRTLHDNQYSQLFRVFRQHKDVIDVVTFWNVSDRDSWVGVNNYPLLFDKDGKRKSSYRIVKNFNAALDNQEIKEDFKPSELNQPGQEYPMVNSQGFARFRVVAPQAKSVIVSLGLGGNMGGVGATVLQKNDEGVWEGTTEGPMDEGFHYYHLTIDGGVVNDPGALNYYGSVRWESGIEIPAHDADFYTAKKDVPHGLVQQIIFWSESTGKFQRAFVYTPPTYNNNPKEKFPVLYLQHGWGEDETAWSNQGHENLIMDNLIAEGKCKPFIIVNAYGLTNDIKFGSGFGQFTGKEFETLLCNELIPYVDSHFKTKTDRNNRALAGLSMGGMTTKLISSRRTDMFASFGLLSGGQFAPGDFKDNKAVNYLFVGCGSKESPDAINKSAADMKAAGYNCVGYVSEGTAHEFLTWRRCLHLMAQGLFK